MICTILLLFHHHHHLSAAAAAAAAADVKQLARSRGRGDIGFK